LGDSLVEALEAELKTADLEKYVSALFKAEEAFRKELKEYEKKDKKTTENGATPATPLISDLLSGVLFKQLPLKYKLALKLPWQYAVDAFSGFLKELGEGSTEDVITNLAKMYMDRLSAE